MPRRNKTQSRLKLKFSYFLSALSVSFVVFVTQFKKKETYLDSQKALKDPVQVSSSRFWNKNETTH